MSPLTAMEIDKGYITIERKVDLALLEFKKYSKAAINMPRIFPITTRITDNSMECNKEFVN